MKKSTFEQFSDKGISIGEKSKVFVYKNYFKRNRSAITAKDSSKVYVNSNSFSANAIDLEAYQKKAIFGYPAVFLVNEQMDKYKIKNKTPIKVQSIAHMLNDDLLKDLSVFEKLH